MSKIQSQKKFDLSIITIALKINPELIKCLESCKFQKINVEHILVFTKKEKINISSIFKNKYKIIFDDGKGVYNALNLGISKSCGSKILILHGDNYFTDNGPELIEKNITNKNIQFGCYTILKNNFKKFIFLKLNILNLICGLYPPHPGLVLDRDDIKNLGFYDDGYKICADFDYYIKIFRSKLDINYINKEIIVSPTGGISTSGFKSVISIIIERFKILKKYYWFFIALLPITILIGYFIKIIHRNFLNKF